MTSVKLGVTLPQFTGDARVVLDGAKRAERLGLDSIWLFDHLWPLGGKKRRPLLECWSTLAWIAATTEGIGIGSLVTRSSLRHPAVLARMAATVASVAPGRLIVGVGSGDEKSRAENEAYGMPYWAGEDREDQLEATVEVLNRCFYEDLASVHGDHISIQDLPPGPGGPPPAVWVGGTSVSAQNLAGRLADGWNAWEATPDDISAGAVEVARVAGERVVAITWAGQVFLGPTDAAAQERWGERAKPRSIIGGPETVAQRLKELAAAGASHLIASFVNASEEEPLRLIAEEVRPLLDGTP